MRNHSQSQNSNYNRHCFVEISKPSETGITVTADRFANDSFWDYDPNWGVVNDKLGLLHSKTYDATIMTNSQGTKFAERSLDINDFRDIIQVTALFGA